MNPTLEHQMLNWNGRTELKPAGQVPRTKGTDVVKTPDSNPVLHLTVKPPDPSPDNRFGLDPNYAFPHTSTRTEWPPDNNVPAPTESNQHNTGAMFTADINFLVPDQS